MKKVLVVEDNPVDAELVLEILKAQGFIAHVAKDGNEAIKMAEKVKYELIIMDIKLPGMNGTEVKNVIKSKPEYKNTPVVALTAYAMRGDMERFLAAGFDDYMPKPADVSEFMRRMEKYKRI